MANVRHSRRSGRTPLGCLHFTTSLFHSATLNMHRTRHAVAALAASTAAFVATLATLTILKASRRKRRSRTAPKYKRAALLRPERHVQTINMTPWNAILSCGSDDDFLVSLNFIKELFLHKLLPLFNIERLGCNFGSPYRHAPKQRGRNPQLQSVDMLAMALWYIKTKGTMFSLCPVFGIVPSSIGVWMDYSLEVLLRVVKRKHRKEFEVKPTVPEMHASASLLQQNRTYGPLLRGVFAVTDGGRMPCVD